MFNGIRELFPALKQQVHGRPLVYFDTAATALKPQSVIDRLNQFYSAETANVHRGAHNLSARATDQFEASREAVRSFIGAKFVEEIIFTKGTTESINLVARVLGESVFRPGDEIILTEMEHHSNIVPWQNIAEEKQLHLKWISVAENGELEWQKLDQLLNERTRLLAITQASNALGTVNQLEQIMAKVQARGIQVLVDAAQSITFQKVDVQRMGCDYLVFSAHKLYGPYGVGVLYMRKNVSEHLPPYQFGGAMIEDVNKDRSTYLSAPQRFEAGTPNISGVVALHTAIQFVDQLEWHNIYEHESRLLKILENELHTISGLKIVGRSPTKTNLLSFVVYGVHHADLATLLDQQGIAVRAGHHCALPLMKKLGLPGTTRISLGVYNDENDVEILLVALKKSLEILR